MQIRRHKVHICSAVLISTIGFGGFLSVSAVSAQESERASSHTLEEIIVTARKREESLQNTPIAVSAFSEAMLEDRAVTNTAQIEQFTPNLIFDTSEGVGGGSSAQVFIRGIGQSDFNIGTEPGVGIYLDGVYIGRTPGAVFDLMDIERVEVLRGPQGTLFGRNTIGGAVNLTSQRPSENFGGRVDVTTGTDERIDLKATLDVPLGDTLRAKITGLRKSQDGFVDVVNTGQKLGDVDVLAGRFALEWDASSILNFMLSTDVSRQRQAGAPTTGLFFDDTFLAPGTSGPPTDSGMPFSLGTIAGFYNTVGQNGIPGVLPPPNAGSDLFDQSLVNANGNCPFALGVAPNSATDNLNCFNAQYDTGDPFSTFGSLTENDIDIFGSSLTATLDINDNLSLKSITAYREMESRFTNDIDNSPLPVGETENNINQEQFSQEIQLIGTHNRLKWVAGFFYFNEKADDSGQITTGSGNFINGATIDNKAYALFGQLTYNITEKLSLTAGGRYTEEDKSFLPESSYVTTFFIPPPFFNLPENSDLVTEFGGNGCNINPDGSGACSPNLVYIPATNLQQDVDEFQPLVNLSLQATDNLLVYVNYSEGFKSGGGNQRVIFPALDASFLLYGPEFATVYEGGFKASLFGNRARLNGAVFYTDYEDIQINIQIGFVPTVQNAGDGEVKGFELELEARPIANLDLSVSLGYTDAEYTKVNPNAVATLDSVFANTPEWSASAGVAYTIGLPGGHRLIPRLDWSFTSKIHNDADNNPELVEGSLHLLNAGVMFESVNEKWRAVFMMTNLTNEEYVVAGFRNTVGGFGQGIVARDRQWLFRLSYSY